MTGTRPSLRYRLLALAAALPLPVIHAAGMALGWAMYLLSPSYARLMRDNIAASGLCPDHASYRRLLRQNIGESGKSALEAFAIWLRDEQDVLPWVREVQGWEQVEAAQAAGRGILFLTPHLGCFEITSLYYGRQRPLTVMYRPPKKTVLLPLMLKGRSKGLVKLAPATAQGVRSLMQALKRGEAIGILPDQIPAEGEGEWAPYFGRPAYTMTLASRLAAKTGATVIMAFGERLPQGRGYRLHLQALPAGAIDTVGGLNAAIEAQVRLCPQQYAWNYHRHKVRRRAAPMPSTLH